MGRKTSRIVLGGDLNHHGTLFAGQMAKWVVEACLIEAAKAVGSAERLVCVNIEGLTFRIPVGKGQVVDIDTAIDRVGRTSMRVRGLVFSAPAGDAPILETAVTFVNLGEDGRPAPHLLPGAAAGQG